MTVAATQTKSIVRMKDGYCNGPAESGLSGLSNKETIAIFDPKQI